MYDQNADLSTPVNGFVATNREGYNNYAFHKGDFSVTKVAIYWELVLVICL